MADDRIIHHCQTARDRLREAMSELNEAAWVAREAQDYELDKALTAVAETINGTQLVLISLPRLKG